MTKVLTTHHLQLLAAGGPETIDSLRAALEALTTELDGLTSAALYATRNGSEALVLAHWRDTAAVTRAMESIYANPALPDRVRAGEFRVYTLVDEIRAGA